MTNHRRSILELVAPVPLIVCLLMLASLSCRRNAAVRTDTIFAQAPAGEASVTRSTTVAQTDLPREQAQALISQSELFLLRSSNELAREVNAVTGIVRDTTTAARVEFTWRYVDRTDIPSTPADERLKSFTNVSLAHLTLFDDGWRVTKIDEFVSPIGKPKELVLAQMDRESALLSRQIEQLEQSRKAVSFPGGPPRLP